MIGFAWGSVHVAGKSSKYIIKKTMLMLLPNRVFSVNSDNSKIALSLLYSAWFLW